MHYVSSAQKPTSVSTALVGNFTGPDDLNLILSKTSRFEIHVATEAGLQPVKDVPIYGRIATMHLYRPQGAATDHLLITTERYNFFVLSYNQHSGEIVTDAQGNLSDPISRPADYGQLCVIDPEHRMIGLHLYQGLLKVIPISHPSTQWDSRFFSETDSLYRPPSAQSKGKTRGSTRASRAAGVLGTAFNMRLEGLKVLTMVFLSVAQTVPLPPPMLAVLHENSLSERIISIYKVNISDSELEDTAIECPDVHPTTSMLIPVEQSLGGGLLAISDSSITYYPLQRGFDVGTISIKIGPTIVKCYARLGPKGDRYLLGDYMGNLHILLLTCSAGGAMRKLTMERLGKISVPSSIAYIDNDFAFIGSHFGDSQLVKLETRPLEDKSFVSVKQLFPNISPVLDFCLVDSDKQGKDVLVACCGGYLDGSLRIIRNGIGIHEYAELEMPGLKLIWSLQSAAGESEVLVLSFINETRLLTLAANELVEPPRHNLVQNEPTLWASNDSSGNIIQVVPSGVFLISGDGQTAHSKWMPPSGMKIYHASAKASSVLVSLGRGEVVALSVESTRIQQIGRTNFGREVSCVDLALFEAADGTAARYCSVGLWGPNACVHILSFPSLQALKVEALGDAVPRSLTFCRMETEFYVIVALGDGSLINYAFDPSTNTLSDKKRARLGNRPVNLCQFRSNGKDHIFASCDRPTVISGTPHRKLGYSTVNAKEISSVCSFSTPLFPGALAMATTTGLKIGLIDEIQKIHIQKVSLDEMPRRIAYLEDQRMFGLITHHIVSGSNGSADGIALEQSYLRILDDQTYQVSSSHALRPNEVGMCIAAVQFPNEMQSFFVLGSGIEVVDGEINTGYLSVFEISDMKNLRHYCSVPVAGGVYGIGLLSCGLLAVAVSNSIIVFQWKDSTLQMVCSHHAHTIAVDMKVEGNTIIVGDLMKSVSLLEYVPERHILEETYRDFQSLWITRVNHLGASYIAANHTFNLLSFGKVISDEPGAKALQQDGQWHLGEMVNQIKQGSLTRAALETEKLVDDSLVFCTVNGMIGVISKIADQSVADALQILESNLSQFIKSIGDISLADWRSYWDGYRVKPAKNFLDGDVIEKFLELDQDDRLTLIEGKAPGMQPVPLSEFQMMHIVEELSRMH
ncbi:mono-functional DNA-alkylating methyl methanesulfonate N-term-domain-containing protein [Polychytrium aggregatum]|uniref:mono-functional DNA-alkylating methyl methanesulfonate N-term-domain-containing protein n=1 Tax=Polychytrium aggregatum TaxID=110093 RepID=UPI0022FEA3EF|nr:mono-functional DNA-alkylating methyl methanesulfonate N-term-domain-containing protein [Polychytrium aggregatum]KAI9202714.1 mono-functional DNA-alkylating methyl methanesulfonate N-term-domain-containing protein [Polychytrium aggregatum]